MEWAFIGALAAVVLLIVYFLKKQAPGKVPAEELRAVRAENERLKIDLAKAEERIFNIREEKENLFSLLKQEQESLREELRLEREKLAGSNRSLESIRSYYQAQQEKVLEQKAEIEKLKEKLTKEFELIAGKILEEKTHKFTEVNRNNLDMLLNPLKENIRAFEEKVDKVYKTESDERNVLKGELSKLMELNQQISQEAHNLTRALKTDSKKQGNWGEIVLDRILETSGLIPGENYIRQTSFADESGNRLQPDIVVILPDKKHIVIDAKVSLTAYEKLLNCDTEEERKLHLRNHLDSIKNHIVSLQSKNYQNLYGINSPDFVLLFVPIESSFAVAVQHDQDLFDFAWNKRVVIVTPSTLLATLKTVASIWKQELQTRNAIDIALKAGALYDKFAGFVNDLKKIGEHIDRAKNTYNDAFGKLSSGNGNIMGRIETLRKLGAKASKQLDQNLLLEEEQ